MIDSDLIDCLDKNNMEYTKNNYGIIITPHNPQFHHFQIKVYPITKNDLITFQYNLYIYPESNCKLYKSLQLKYGTFILGRFVKTFSNLNDLMYEIYELNTINIKKSNHIHHHN